VNPPRDPAVLLATLRAAGSLSVDDTSTAVVEAMRARAEDTGRVLVRCAPPAGRAGRGRSHVITFGWSPRATPSPEDSNAYPVRRLATTARLTWACCLGLAWPDRTGEPYPGVPFATSVLIDVATELGMAASWVKASLAHDLVPAHLVTVSGATVRLGPAAAGLPPAFVDSMRRFHEQLPRLNQSLPAPSDSSEGNEPAPSSAELLRVPSEEDWEW
jgi:hypothetical protein